MHKKLVRHIFTEKRHSRKYPTSKGTDVNLRGANQARNQLFVIPASECSKKTEKIRIYASVEATSNGDIKMIVTDI